MKSFFISLTIAALLCAASVFYSHKLKSATGMLLNDTQTICKELDDNDLSAAAQSKVVRDVLRGAAYVVMKESNTIKEAFSQYKQSYNQYDTYKLSYKIQ